MQASPSAALLPSPSSLTGLALLRARIRAADLPGKHPGNLLLATWNIREPGQAHRSPEALRMLAELIACFDLVSVVELRANVADLRTVPRYRKRCIEPIVRLLFSRALAGWLIRTAVTSAGVNSAGMRAGSHLAR